jgi:tetratricopeptide (TPR) repeat protein
LDIDQNDAGGWYNRGTDLGKLGRYEEAINSENKAIELNPNDAKAWKDKGITLALLGKYQEAIKCCDKAIELIQMML